MDLAQLVEVGPIAGTIAVVANERTAQRRCSASSACQRFDRC